MARQMVFVLLSLPLAICLRRGTTHWACPVTVTLEKTASALLRCISNEDFEGTAPSVKHLSFKAQQIKAWFGSTSVWTHPLGKKRSPLRDCDLVQGDFFFQGQNDIKIHRWCEPAAETRCTVTVAAGSEAAAGELQGVHLRCSVGDKGRVRWATVSKQLAGEMSEKFVFEGVEKHLGVGSCRLRSAGGDPFELVSQAPFKITAACEP